jgi:hypothetical protein
MEGWFVALLAAMAAARWMTDQGRARFR